MSPLPPRAVTKPPLAELHLSPKPCPPMAHLPPWRLITSSQRRGWISFAVLLALAGAPAAEAANAPPSVVVTPATESDVSTNLGYVGHVIPIQSVKLVPRVTAFIDDVPAKQGSDVKAGEVLFELQKAQYQAALQTAEASLASAQAAVANADVTVARDKNLNTHGFSPASTLDQDIATRNEDQANVLSATAAIAQAE